MIQLTEGLTKKLSMKRKKRTQQNKNLKIRSMMVCNSIIESNSAPFAQGLNEVVLVHTVLFCFKKKGDKT